MSDQKFFVLAAGRGTPSVTMDPDELATKTYVASAINGIDWQESVTHGVDYVKTTTGAPSGTPGSGEKCLNTNDAYLYTESTGSWDAGVACTDQHRYIFKDTGTDSTGDSGTYTADNKIYYYNAAAFEEFTPSEGSAAWIEDENASYVHNGTGWVKLGTTYNHNDLASKQGGTTDEFYHITANQEAGLDAATAITASNPPLTEADRGMVPVPIKFAYLGGIAVSQTNTKPYEVNGVFQGIVMPANGSIVKTSVQVSSSRTAGSLTVEPTIAGAKVTANDLDLVINGDNADYHYATVAPGTTNLTFTAGQEVGFMLTTDGDWAPTDCDVECTLFVVFD